MPDSRREFLWRSAVASLLAAPAAQQAVAANGKFQVGVVGTGGRGFYLMQRAYAGSEPRIAITGVCDTYSPNLNKAKDLVQTKGNTPKTYVDYKELLADKSIDAVIIATPEHLHHRMLLDALAAGKNVYIEKPLSHTIEEAQEIKRVAAASKSVVQVGTQNRSNSLYQMAKTLIAQGLIGDVHCVRAFWYRNALANGAPAWRYTVPAESTEQNTDWKKFVGPAPARPFNKNRFFQWRLYWDYSNGIATDLMVHQTDIAAYCLGVGIPSELVASGAVYRWTENDDREVPDMMSCLLEYPEQKLQMNYSCYLGNAKFGYGEQFMGNDGTIEVNSRQFLNYFPESYPGVPEAIKARKEMSVALPGNDNLAVEAHIRNWLDAIQGKAQLIAPVSAGFEAAVTGLLSTVSIKAAKKVYWDAKTEKYRTA